MRTFIVTAEDRIMVLPAGTTDESRAAGERFGSQAELASLAAKWPASRLVAIWNALPGVALINKFTDRKTAVRRIWEKVQLLDGNGALETAAVAPKRRPTAKDRRGKQKAATGRENSKSSQVIGLLKRGKGATLAEIMETTGWQPHSVRGFLSGTLGKKMGLKITSSKRQDGERVYSCEK